MKIDTLFLTVLSSVVSNLYICTNSYMQQSIMDLFRIENISRCQLRQVPNKNKWWDSQLLFSMSNKIGNNCRWLLVHSCVHNLHRLLNDLRYAYVDFPFQFKSGVCSGHCKKIWVSLEMCLIHLTFKKFHLWPSLNLLAEANTVWTEISWYIHDAINLHNHQPQNSPNALLIQRHILHWLLVVYPCQQFTFGIKNLASV